MARVMKTVESDKEEVLEILEDGEAPAPVHTFPDGIPEAHRAAVENAKAMATATTAKPKYADEPPKSDNKQFRVTNHEPVRVMVGGYVTMFKPGKVVDSSVFHLESLRSQGVKLEEI